MEDRLKKIADIAHRCGKRQVVLKLEPDWCIVSIGGWEYGSRGVDKVLDTAETYVTKMYQDLVRSLTDELKRLQGET